MSKKGKNNLEISQSVEKMARAFCESNNRDISEFIEEAVIEKIEYEEYNASGPGGDIGNYMPEEISGDEFKRKH